MKNYYLILIIFFSLFVACNSADKSTIIVIEQNKDAVSEAQRLRHIMTKYDRQLTGFYLPPGKGLNVNVEVITQGDDNSLPQLVVGTPRRKDNQVKVIPLVEGMNEIAADSSQGGMIYLEYTIKDNRKPGKAKVTFVEGEDSFIKAPFYVKGKTTQEEFLKMMETYSSAPDVTFMSDIMAVVVSREAALKYSVKEDINTWMNSIEKILKAEDDISGIDANDPNPLHHPLAKGIRYLLVEVNTGYMYATSGLTGYNGDAALRRLLTNHQITTNGWGVSHELGHQHQQSAYKPSYFTEVTVNIYSAAAWRVFYPNKERTKKEIWDKLMSDYFTLPDGKRNFHDHTSYQSVGSQHDTHFLLFEQLRVLFGEEFFKRLHRITREEKKEGGDNGERVFYLIWKTCQITGYDLRDYFDKWAIKLNPYYQNVLAKEIKAHNLNKPEHVDEYHLVNPYNVPTWVPVALKGISSSEPVIDAQPENQRASLEKYTDYSSSKDIFTDPRDNKTYPYKRFGKYEWFTKNLDWDGYDGKDEKTRGTVGVYGTGDPDGSLYGRLYPTNVWKSINTLCPEGWTLATPEMWDFLVQHLTKQYKVSFEDLSPYLKAGGDRDEEDDGLWAKGAGSINKQMAAKIGLNVLPAGVFNIETQDYDIGDEPGNKASFPGAQWNHIQFTAGSNVISAPNRNSRHHGSARCVRAVE